MICTPMSDAIGLTLATTPRKLVAVFDPDDEETLREGGAGSTASIAQPEMHNAISAGIHAQHRPMKCIDELLTNPG